MSYSHVQTISFLTEKKKHVSDSGARGRGGEVDTYLRRLRHIYSKKSTGNSIPIGSLRDSASETDSKSNELKMSNTQEVMAPSRHD